MADRFGIVAQTDAGPGVLHQLTGVVARRRGDIASVDIISQADGEARIYFEIEMEEYEALRRAFSKGAHFNREIKPRHRYALLSGERRRA